jgi:hypothetical protein
MHTFSMDEPLSEQELSELEALTEAAAAPAPWVAFVEGPGIGGDSMIRVDGIGDFPPDMYIMYGREIAPSADIEFIAAARNYMPRLLAELRQRRGSQL